MDIIVNSLYSDKSVFLRELVSNSADACDKRRFLSLTSDDSSPASPSIRLKGDASSKTLIIEDEGIGMTKAEIIANLGRIAQSGTAKFAESMKASKDDLSLIGQFGVGFYSGFLVADSMTVETKSALDGAPDQWHKWESKLGDSYTIEPIEPPTPLSTDEPFTSGTRITLHLKDDCLNFAESFAVTDLLRKYSEFIDFPIDVFTEKTTYKTVDDEEANKDLEEGEERKTKSVPETNQIFERQNTVKPIWLRSPKEVNDTEYAEFYKSAFKMSYDEPMKHTHFSLEGNVEMKSVLYVPGMLPFELSKNMFDEDAGGLRLYVKRVFINDKFEELMPRYLKFIKGVVDSNDLPLNVGREILQKSKMLNVINKRLVRKSLDMIGAIAAEGEETYGKFWKNFGKYIKVGVIEDEINTQELAKLCRFQSTESGEDWRSLQNYVDDMKEGQDKIYYVTGEGKAAASMSPALEGLKKKGFEVLFMTEPLDEIAMQTLGVYKVKVGAVDKELKVMDATKAKFEESEDDKKMKEDSEERLKGVIEFLTEELGSKVSKVEVSTRLIESPAAMVQGEYGMSPSMQRYMQAQAVAMGEGDMSGMLGQMNQQILEINPEHKIVGQLEGMLKKGDKEASKVYGALLFDLAGITSGYNIEDPKAFSDRLVDLMEMVGNSGGGGGLQDAAVVE